MIRTISRFLFSASAPRAALAAVLLAFVVAVPASAATHTWLGTVSDRVSDPENWSGGSPAGDPEATIVFPLFAVRFDVVNDVPDLRFKELSFNTDHRSTYTLAGDRLIAIDAAIEGGDATIACNVHVTGTLKVHATELVLSGAISGGGGVEFDAFHSTTILSGSASNTYRGTTRVTAANLHLAKSGGATAIPGAIELGWSSRITVDAPEQIPDHVSLMALGSWPHGGLVLNANETIAALELRQGASVAGLATALLTVKKLAIGVRESSIATQLRVTESVHIEADGALIATAAVHLPAEGLTLAGGGRTTWKSGDAAPIRIDGVHASLDVPNADVEVTNGTFRGVARSIVATGGAVAAFRAAGDVRLNPNVSFLVGTPASVAGALDLGGATLVLREIAPNLGTPPLLLISNDSTRPVIGTFAGLPEGGLAEGRYRVSYVGGDGNDVTLTAIPAPHPVIWMSLESGFIGEPSIVRVSVGYGSLPYPTGVVVLRDGDGVELGTMVLHGGWGSMPVIFRHAVTDVHAHYLGDANYGGSTSEVLRVEFKYRPPVVHSVTPAKVKGGQTAEVVVRGEHFAEGSVVDASGLLEVEKSEWVSRSEMRVRLRLHERFDGAALTVVVGRGTVIGEVSSNSVRLLADRPVEPPQRMLSVGNSSAIARVTPGADSAWVIAPGMLPSALVPDDDRDGRVSVFAPGALRFGVIDLATGAWDVDAFYSEVQPLPPHTFVRDGAGKSTRIVLNVGEPDVRRPYSVLWARPGVGAWRALLVDGREREDDDRSRNGVIFSSIEWFVPLARDGAARPAEVQRGDVVIFLPLHEYDNQAPVYAGTLGERELNSTAPGVLRVAQHTWTAIEEERVAKVTVIRTDGATGRASVRYTTVSRAPGVRPPFVPTSGEITFERGETVKTIEIPLVDDEFYRGSPMFHVVLSEPDGARLGDETVAVVTIRDDERKPVLRFGSMPPIFEGDSPWQLPLELTRDVPMIDPLTVRWQGNAFIPAGQVTFSPGEMRKTLFLTIVGDDEYEPYRGDRAFYVYFAVSPELAEIPRYLYMNVLEDDVSIVSAPSLTVSESDGEAVLRVSVVRGTQLPLTLQYALFRGTASGPEDYAEATDTITIAPGETSAEIRIAIVDDGAAEGSEWFKVQL
ncbi:MAG TPA: Calx-beta domain-containing protein, partial [Thermoanaerobaculia bacterium]